MCEALPPTLETNFYGCCSIRLWAATAWYHDDLRYVLNGFVSWASCSYMYVYGICIRQFLSLPAQDYCFRRSKSSFLH